MGNGIDEPAARLGQRSIPTRRALAIAIALLVVPVAGLFAMWLGSSEPWIHPEQVRASVFVWTPSGQDIQQQLHKALDWAALDTPDPTHWRDLAPAHRVRPFGDLSIVADAVARPYATEWFFPHPTLTPSAIITVFLTPVLLFLFVLRVTRTPTAAAIIVGLFLSGISFLSAVIPDIHSGAKRLSLLLLAFALLMAELHKSDNRRTAFWLSVIAVFLALFTDEMALGTYAAIFVLYGPLFLRKGNGWKAAVFLSMPVLFIATVKWGMPALYSAFGTPGMPQFNAFGDGRKLGLVNNLAHGEFYVLWLKQTARAILAAVGILSHGDVIESATLGVVIVGSLAAAYRSIATGANDGRHHDLLLSLVALGGNAFYLTLLDQYPPGGTGYLGSYTYYYHCSLGLLVLVWATYLWRVLASIQWKPISTRTRRFTRWGMVCVYLTVVLAGFKSFHTINKLVSLAHWYPYDSFALYEQIRALPRSNQFHVARPGDTIRLDVASDCSKVVAKFDETFAATFGDQSWGENEFHRAFLSLYVSNRDVEHLFKTYFPMYDFQVAPVNDCPDDARRVSRAVLQPAHGVPGQEIKLAASGFKPVTGFYVRWGEPHGPNLGSDMMDGWGNARTTIRVPQLPPGDYAIYVTDERTHLAMAPFTVDTQRR